MKDYQKFGIMNGHAISSAFKNLNDLNIEAREIDDEKTIDNILRIINKGNTKDNSVKFDSESWWDSIGNALGGLWGEHDSMYEGTIYIPMRSDTHAGIIGGGTQPNAAQMAEIEAREQ